MFIFNYIFIKLSWNLLLSQTIFTTIWSNLNKRTYNVDVFHKLTNNLYAVDNHNTRRSSKNFQLYTVNTKFVIFVLPLWRTRVYSEECASDTASHLLFGVRIVTELESGAARDNKSCKHASLSASDEESFITILTKVLLLNF